MNGEKPARAIHPERLGIPPGLPYVVVDHKFIYQGNRKVAIVLSYTMARRIAAALNQYVPDERGL
jgi:hypothetical protein